MFEKLLDKSERLESKINFKYISDNKMLQNQ
jgi:hypothetical protein